MADGRSDRTFAGALLARFPVGCRMLCTALMVGVPGLIFAFQTGIVAAQTVNGAELRRAAEILSPLAIASGDEDLLIAAINGLLDGGATLQPDDPWGAHDLMTLLRDMDATSGRFAQDIARIESRSRGVISGPNRYDSNLAGGGFEEFRLKVAANEHAIAEARLKKGVSAADIDLIVSEPGGQIVTSDSGPDTGIPGIGTYVEWWPENCEEVIVRIHNNSDNSASFVFLAPPAASQDCHE